MASALFLCEGRDGLADRLYGLYLARQAVGHQGPERSARAGRLRERQGYFYTRRGQLNFSCATCHVQNPGERIRAEILAPALGILNAMPIYRSEWSGMGTISRRFITCNSQTRGFRWNRNPTNIATSNISCPMSPTACRSRVREHGHERRRNVKP